MQVSRLSLIAELGRLVSSKKDLAENEKESSELDSTQNLPSRGFSSKEYGQRTHTTSINGPSRYRKCDLYHLA